MWAIAITVIPMETVTIMDGPIMEVTITTATLIMVVIMIVILTETTGDYRSQQRVR